MSHHHSSITPGKLVTWVQPRSNGIRIWIGFRTGDDSYSHFTFLAKLNDLEARSSSDSGFQSEIMKTDFPSTHGPVHIHDTTVGELRAVKHLWADMSTDFGEWLLRVLRHEKLSQETKRWLRTVFKVVAPVALT